MFKKILIANRGAIACRIIRTLSNLGIASVAVFAESDRDSLHVSMADFSFSLGEGTAEKTYLDIKKIISIAQQADVDALHPGYGFLSENAYFVDALENANITFIGPTVFQMNAFGLKHKARDLALSCDIPLLEGSGLLKDAGEAIKIAEKIGYPVILKSTAGGGGIGMKVCVDAGEVEGSFESVARSGEKYFSDSSIFIEKYIAHARHIEVQAFGDGKGQVLTLGERDCSIQRRNQKVIEEAPAFNLNDQQRKKLQETAKQLLSSVKYQNAGTVEFIYDTNSHEFFFLEVNTRLQVEHGITEAVYQIDIVEWMIKLAEQSLPSLSSLEKKLSSEGHAIQVRIYAEDANKNFQPSAGLLTEVQWPSSQNLRIDTWISAGVEVSSYFDPLLAKMIVKGENREDAIKKLQAALNLSSIYGIETNMNYLKSVINSDAFKSEMITTKFLNAHQYMPQTIDVESTPRQSTTIQSYPGRLGFWSVGVPPSGPFDSYSFRLANQMLGNDSLAAGLEITVQGPTLKFNCERRIVVTGAEVSVCIDDNLVPMWTILSVKAQSVVQVGTVSDVGLRAYVCVDGGICCPDYLGSKTTFTLGQFGGHAGRALLNGDVLQLGSPSEDGMNRSSEFLLSVDKRPEMTNCWDLRVMSGPHGSPDFFTQEDIVTIIDSSWTVHFNSNRTGIRLIGPKPAWARESGGEAGLHPSNIHDNAYAIGSVNFTGDMPVILGPDGPSLGGFVCPFTVISGDLWKLGQLKSGDKVRLIPVSFQSACEIALAVDNSINQLAVLEQPAGLDSGSALSPIIKHLEKESFGAKVVYRQAGDCYVLVEYGELELDLRIRFRVHALMQQVELLNESGIIDLTPGVRSLQIHFNPAQLCREKLLKLLVEIETSLTHNLPHELPSRIIHLPLSWDDPECQTIIDRYVASVRADAPWCPSNIEFIRRINGLTSVDAVKKMIFDTQYLVLGLGDVYLGAPVATPIDPSKRLVTTKYNPARTWTSENVVGIGGAYLCIYGMEGPGGFQLFGRTLQMWNKYHKTAVFNKPWLLRFFDQIQFFPVTHQELKQIRRDFLKGEYTIKIEESTFDILKYESFLKQNKSKITEFSQARESAFQSELNDWLKTGKMNFIADSSEYEKAKEIVLQSHQLAIESPVTGIMMKQLASIGEQVESGQVLAILESMKMEVELNAPGHCIIDAVVVEEGQQVVAGDTVMIVSPDKPA